LHPPRGAREAHPGLLVGVRGGRAGNPGLDHARRPIARRQEDGARYDPLWSWAALRRDVVPADGHIVFSRLRPGLPARRFVGGTGIPVLAQVNHILLELQRYGFTLRKHGGVWVLTSPPGDPSGRREQSFTEAELATGLLQVLRTVEKESHALTR